MPNQLPRVFWRAGDREKQKLWGPGTQASPVSARRPLRPIQSHPEGHPRPPDTQDLGRSHLQAGEGPQPATDGKAPTARALPGGGALGRPCPLRPLEKSEGLKNDTLGQGDRMTRQGGGDRKYGKVRAGAFGGDETSWSWFQPLSKPRPGSRDRGQPMGRALDLGGTLMSGFPRQGKADGAGSQRGGPVAPGCVPSTWGCLRRVVAHRADELPAPTAHRTPPCLSPQTTTSLESGLPRPRACLRDTALNAEDSGKGHRLAT